MKHVKLFEQFINEDVEKKDKHSLILYLKDLKTKPREDTVFKVDGKVVDKAEIDKLIGAFNDHIGKEDKEDESTDDEKWKAGKSSTKKTIEGYVDEDDEPMYYINRLSNPKFKGEDMSSGDVESAIAKNPKGKYVIVTGSGEQFINVTVDAKGIIKDYNRKNSPQFDSEGIDRFSAISGTEEES